MAVFSLHALVGQPPTHLLSLQILFSALLSLHILFSDVLVIETVCSCCRQTAG